VGEKSSEGLGGWNIARTGGHISRLAGRVLGGPLGVVRPVFEKMECRFGVVLGVEGDIESSLTQVRRKSSHSPGLSSINKME